MIQPSEVFEFESLRKEGNKATAEWLVAIDCPYLDGHFPDQPVLPAVGMIDGSLELIRLCGVCPPAGQLSLKKAKFAGVVSPGMRMNICLEQNGNRYDVEWKNSNGAPLASFSFRI